MSNSNTDLILKLNTATIWINHIYPVLQIIFGTFGNLFNLIIFSRRALRTNPCSMYFFVGSINNLYVIYLPLLTRYLGSTWNIDPSTTNNVWCKLRNFLIYPPLTLALWFIVLASIDRFFSSSSNPRFRQLSNMSLARKSIIIITIVIFLSYVHILIFFKTVTIGPMNSCIMWPYEYVIFLSFFAPIISCVLPIVLMSIFGILMIINVRNVHNRILPQFNNGRNERWRSHDRQLIVMLLFQVLVITLISTPYFALAIYNAIAVVIFQYKLSSSGEAIYNFSYNLFRLLYYTNPIISFYIYTLTGPKFRAELKRCTIHGLKFVLTKMHVIQYLPVRVQQPALSQKQRTTNMQLITVRSKYNVVHPIRKSKTSEHCSCYIDT